jgi:SpoVK/Ycf46/Vps4 family AAA+-type ATPase
LENITKYIGDNDNIRLLIIGTGNFPELIDPALKAPHRLGNPLTVSQPDAVGRADVIETDMKRLKITLASDFSLDAAQKEAGRKQFIERAVTGSEGMTIAEIKKIFTNLTAIHSDFYTVEHLSSAISRTKSEIEKNKETLQKI